MYGSGHRDTQPLCLLSPGRGLDGPQPGCPHWLQVGHLSSGPGSRRPTLAPPGCFLKHKMENSFKYLPSLSYLEPAPEFTVDKHRQ